MLYKKLKIGYFADGPWSHKAFELIIQNPNFEIKFIVPRTDTTDDTLKQYCSKYNIEYLHLANINSVEFINQAKSFDCDLFVSMSFNQIFRKSTFSLPPLGTINCHAGKLPFYRGRNILNWALINDENEFGITVHFVDEGIDTGDIVLQRIFPISDSDDYNILLDRAYDECAKILYDALILIQEGNVIRINQSSIHPVGFYCGMRSVGDEVINWNQPSRQVFNFIRALCKPGPVAKTFSNGQLVRINKAKIIKDAPKYINTPGQLLAKTKEGFLVKTQDSFIEIFEIETDVKLRVGLKLSTNG